MPGAHMIDVGDVQIGADDADPVVLHFPHISGVSQVGSNRQRVHAEAQRGRQVGAWVMTDFNPSVSMDVNSMDAPHVHRPGLKGGPDIATTRKFEFTIWVRDVSRPKLNERVQALMRHLSPLSADPYMHPTSLPLVEQELAWYSYIDSGNAQSYVMYGRFRGVGMENLSHLGTNAAKIKVRFEALDPLIYDTRSSFITLNKNNTYQPHPLLYASGQPAWPGGSSSTVYISGNPPLPGSGPSRWWLTIQGPASNPAVFFRKTAYSGNYQTRVYVLGVGATEDLALNRVTLGTTSEVVKFDSGQRTTLMVPNLYWDNRLTPGSSWPEAYPRIEMIFCPNGVDPLHEDPPVDSTNSKAEFHYRRGWWYVV